MTPEYVDSVTRVRLKLEKVFGTTFKMYYDGDPEGIPLFNLPAIIVDQPNDRTASGTFGQDDISDELVVKVVMNKRDDFTGSKVEPLNLTSRRIRDLVGQRDLTTGNYAEDTVKSVVRSLAHDEGVTCVLSDMEADYGIVPRPTPRGAQAEYADLTQEGHLKFSIQYSVDRPNQ